MNNEQNPQKLWLQSRDRRIEVSLSIKNTHQYLQAHIGSERGIDLDHYAKLFKKDFPKMLELDDWARQQGENRQ